MKIKRRAKLRLTLSQTKYSKPRNRKLKMLMKKNRLGLSEADLKKLTLLQTMINRIRRRLVIVRLLIRQLSSRLLVCQIWLAWDSQWQV